MHYVLTAFAIWSRIRKLTCTTFLICVVYTWCMISSSPITVLVSLRTRPAHTHWAWTSLKNKKNRKLTQPDANLPLIKEEQSIIKWFWTAPPPWTPMLSILSNRDRQVCMLYTPARRQIKRVSEFFKRIIFSMSRIFDETWNAFGVPFKNQVVLWFLSWQNSSLSSKLCLGIEKLGRK
jgi:hypothetical protein